MHLGRYRLLKRLATGGMAEIYLAEQEAETGLSRHVVIKTILPQFTKDAAMRTMLLDEARLGFSLRHRNIVQVVDVGDEDDLLYIAMEYVEGVNLAEWAAAPANRASLDSSVIAYIGLEVLAALDYAHNRSKDGASLEIVHRDVSPQNILVSTAGELKLSDFGIALAKDRITQTTVGGVKGKLSYIPPEQATGAGVAASADVFSAAAVLLELLTGDGPYQADTDIGILKAMERGDIAKLEPTERVPAGLAIAINRGLSANVHDRPTAREMRESLEQFATTGSQAEAILREGATRARELLAQQSKHQRRFENALLAQSAGERSDVATNAMSATPSVSRKPRVALLSIAAALLAAGLGIILWKTSETGSTLALQNAALIDASVQPFPPPLSTDAAVLVPPVATAIDASPPSDTQRKAPASRFGRLTITSFPWAEVEVDGKNVGNTPIRGLRLRAGKRRVVLRNPQSGKRVTRTVTVKAGKNASLRIEL